MGRGSRGPLAQAEVSSEAFEVGAGQGFRENVGDIVTGADTCDRDFTVGNELADGVVFHTNVFHLRVPDMVLGEAAGRVVIAVEGGGVRLGKADAIKELAEEYRFMGRVVQRDVFGIARGIRNNFLLLR